MSLLSPRDFTNTVMKGGKIKRHRNGYQVFSAEEWYRVKSEMSKDSGFSEITREVGKQVPRPALPEQTQRHSKRIFVRFSFLGTYTRRKSAFFWALR